MSQGMGNPVLFLELWWEVWGFSLVTMGKLQGLSMALREVQSPFKLPGGARIVLKSQQGIRLQFRMKWGSQGLFQVVAGNFGFTRVATVTSGELLMVPLGSQECHVVRGLSGFLWDWVKEEVFISW